MLIQSIFQHPQQPIWVSCQSFKLMNQLITLHCPPFIHILPRVSTVWDYLFWYILQRYSRSNITLTPFAGLVFAAALCEVSNILVVDTALNCEYVAVHRVYLTMQYHVVRNSHTCQKIVQQWQYIPLCYRTSHVWRKSWLCNKSWGGGKSITEPYTMVK